MNSRSHLEQVDYTINSDGIPCCPADPALLMKYEATSRLKRGAIRYKFVCPKMRWVYNSATKKAHRQCFCENPCTTSSCGRMVYLYPEKDLRTYPDALRGTPEWDETYKVRTTVERSINHIKDSFCLAGRKTQNEKTLHADLLLAGITQLLGVLLADKIHQHIREHLMLPFICVPVFQLPPEIPYLSDHSSLMFC